MKEEVYWNTTSEQIERDLFQFENQKVIPKGFSKEEFFSIRNEVQSLIERYTGIKADNKRFFLTGHQCEIFHPGILFKDIILSYLSKKYNAIPIHIIVDTDAFEFIFYFIESINSTLKLNSFKLESDTTYLNEIIINKDREKIRVILQNQLITLKEIINQEIYKEASKYISLFISSLDSGKKLSEISILILNTYIKENSLNIYTIPQSEFIKLNGFKKFVEKIAGRHSEFIEIHNESLKNYRLIHKIKNHAQPIPDMKEEELPFWELDFNTGKRIHANYPPGDKNYSPRAITNTMFFRLFLSDIFIHGRGGARYEQISTEIIEKFFVMNPSLYYVASASLYLSPNNTYPIGEISGLELKQMERDLHHSPEKFLDVGSVLFKEKQKLLDEFKQPDSDKKSLNKKKEELNQTILESIKDKIEYIKKMDKLIPIYEKNREAIYNRTYPFYYYDLRIFKEFTSKDLN